MRQSFFGNIICEHGECIKYGLALVLIKLILPFEIEFHRSQLARSILLLVIFGPIIYMEFQRDWNNFQEDRRDICDIIIRLIAAIAMTLISFICIFILSVYIMVEVFEFFNRLDLGNKIKTTSETWLLFIKLFGWISYSMVLGSIARIWMNVYSLVAITINCMLNLFDYYIVPRPL